MICCVFLNGMDLVLCNCTEREGGEQRIVDVEESARDAIIIVFPSWLRKASRFPASTSLGICRAIIPPIVEAIA